MINKTVLYYLINMSSIFQSCNIKVMNTLMPQQQQEHYYYFYIYYSNNNTNNKNIVEYFYFWYCEYISMLIRLLYIRYSTLTCHRVFVHSGSISTSHRLTCIHGNALMHIHEQSIMLRVHQCTCRDVHTCSSAAL